MRDGTIWYLCDVLAELPHFEGAVPRYVQHMHFVRDRQIAFAARLIVCVVSGRLIRWTMLQHTIDPRHN